MCGVKVTPTITWVCVQHNCDGVHHYYQNAEARHGDR